MPSTIPYDPSLVLGNIVPASKLALLENISKAQAPADAAQDAYNAALTTMRQFEMTAAELASTGIDVKELQKAKEQIDFDVKSTATAYAIAKLKSIQAVAQLRRAAKNDGDDVSDEIESPVDFNRTQIKRLPLATDTMKMDVQYFSFEQEGQTATETIAKMASAVQVVLSPLVGPANTTATAGSLTAMMTSQLEHHDIIGTLVITAACTHKMVDVLAPFVLDVDKGIRAWNAIMGKSHRMVTHPWTQMAMYMDEAGSTVDHPSIQIVSGVVRGSSFVGMVHIVRNSSTRTAESMVSLASSLQEQINVNLMLATLSGGIGLSSSFSHDVKSLLSMAKVQSHCTMITAGVIPSIKANTVETVVEKFLDFNPADMMSKLATLADTNGDQLTTVASAAQVGRTHEQMVALYTKTAQGVISAVGDGDRQSNQVLDTNSLMTAFEDFVNKAIAGESGVPLTYYLKPITRAQLATAWFAKYYPNVTRDSGDDNSQGKQAGSAGTASAPAPAAAPAADSGSSASDASSGSTSGGSDGSGGGSGGGLD